MQILQWLFKISAQEHQEIVSNSSPITQKQGDKDKNTKSKDVSTLSTDRRRHRKRVKKSEFYCENLSLFCFLQRKDVSRPLFYHTLNLKRVQRRRHWVHSMKMKGGDVVGGQSFSNKADSAPHVGNKVLPITDSSQSSSGHNTSCPDADKKDNKKGDKLKTISRMKELLKWAASTKARKSGKIGRMVLNFKSKATLKAGQDNDQFSNESPKISFRWDVESCSTTSSAISSLKNDRVQSVDALLHVRNQGNWITTDSEFVVLEL